jgi:spore coat-associated protein N
MGKRKMTLKKTLMKSFATAVIGIGLISGGTFAYFSDTEESSNVFAAGTLDLNMDPSVLIDVENIKPGDSFTRVFNLANDGTLDIQEVLLHTDYEVIDAEGDNGDQDFGEHIEVEFLYNNNNNDEVIYKTTLAELRDMNPTAVNQHIMYPWLGEKGLPSGSVHEFLVEINFVDNGEDQNVFQGDALQLEWTFEATQNAGEAR